MPRGNNATKKKTTKKKVVKQAVDRSKAKKVKRNFNPAEFISTGSTLLNLALTDHPRCGWQFGKMANLIGDSSSGKTFLALTCFAEAEANSKCSDVAFIYDDAEHANEFDVENLFNEEVEERIAAPEYYDEEPVFSTTVEDFYAYVRNACKGDDRFIYVLDSMDAIGSEDDEKKIKEVEAHRDKAKKAEREGKEVKAITGSFGMGKAKMNSKMLGNICGKVEQANGVLLIVSQTRDDINPMTFTKKTRAGGKALKFYATHEVWTAVGREIKAKERVIGVDCIVKVSKNKITGKRRTIKFPIFYEFGIDNIGSIIDFLVDEGVWKKAKGATTIDPNGDLGLVKATRAKLIRTIEDEDLEPQLDRLVSDAWHGIEDSLKQNRKKRYA